MEQPADASSLTARPEDIRAVPVRHPGRWVVAVVVAFLLVVIVNSVATNPRFGWGTVGH
jgi:polar amino acid transport system permease protein